MNRMPVALFSKEADAESARGRLVQAGIPAELHDELKLERLWYVSKELTGVRLEVPAYEFERACRMLTDWDAADGLMSLAVRCPHCKSFRVDFPQFTRKSFLTNLLVGLSAKLGLVEKDYYCEECHYTWPKNAERPGRERAHLAPNYFIE